ncbi:hypothetical protein ACFLXQ_01885 [Chloroflexota bacterium]
MNLDFTLPKYTALCQIIRALPAETMTLAQFLKAGQPQRLIFILRHDVDRSLKSALRMAELEARLQISSTYYFRTTRAVFRQESLTHLHQLGHEVGYHYEVLTKARGNHQQAIVKFNEELAQFRRIVPVETISMHGSPLLPWDNRDLWQHYDFKEYELLGEAYLSIDYTNVYYFTDTGRSWADGRYNVRDRTGGRKPDRTIRTTDDLIAFLNQVPDSPVLINTHPERWTATRWSWGISAASDWAINRVKRLITWQRGLGQAS